VILGPEEAALRQNRVQETACHCTDAQMFSAHNYQLYTFHCYHHIVYKNAKQ